MIRAILLVCLLAACDSGTNLRVHIPRGKLCAGNQWCDTTRVSGGGCDDQTPSTWGPNGSGKVQRS